MATPLTGADRIARLLLGLFRRGRTLGAHVHPATVNGHPGGILHDDRHHVISVMALDITDGRIRTLHAVINPDKLAHLAPLSDAALVKPQSD